MAIVVPAILAETKEQFIPRLEAVLKIPNLKKVQIDFSDGNFAARRTVMPHDLDLLNPAYSWEAHLMLENPREYFLDLQIAGFTQATIHFESFADHAELQKAAKELKEMKIEPGLAFNPETKVSDITPFLPEFSRVLVLAVHPGSQGQDFLAGTEDKVFQLRKIAKNVIIEIDGGVKLDNAKKLLELGADELVVGSALFSGSLTPTQNYEAFEQLLNTPK